MPRVNSNKITPLLYGIQDGKMVRMKSEQFTLLLLHPNFETLCRLQI
jgi:hypothetical protein